MDSPRLRHLLVFVHSPLLGPYSWAPVADLLAEEGHPVTVPDLRPALAGPPPYYPGLRDTVARAAADEPTRPVVLVGHSAAGPLLPAAAEALGSRVAATVFVDARLPHPEVSWLESLGAERAAQLRTLARDGWLPAWDTWFPEGALDQQVPQPETRQRFRAELTGTPVGLLTEPAPARTPVFDGVEHVYLRLSAGYDDAAETARQLGWRVLRADTGHLAPLTRPADVAGLLRRALPG